MEGQGSVEVTLEELGGDELPLYKHIVERFGLYHASDCNPEVSVMKDAACIAVYTGLYTVLNVYIYIYLVCMPYTHHILQYAFGTYTIVYYSIYILYSSIIYYGTYTISLHFNLFAILYTLYSHFLQYSM